MRLIDADALIEKSLKDANCYMDNNDIKRGCHNVQCLIYDAPTIDVAPVRHGRWVVIDAEEPRRYGCSECKRLSWHMENYCGNCGAKMDEEEDDA